MNCGECRPALGATLLSPWCATLSAAQPFLERSADAFPLLGQAVPADLFLLTATGLTLLLNGIAIALVRVWNPSREARPPGLEDDERVPSQPAVSIIGDWPPHIRLHVAITARGSCREAWPHTARVGQSDPVARSPHLGLWPQDAAVAPGLSGRLCRLGRWRCIGPLHGSGRRR